MANEGNGEAADPKTLDAIMAATWDETMGEDREEIPVGHEHLGEPNDKDDTINAQDDSSPSSEEAEGESEGAENNDTPQGESVDELAAAKEDTSQEDASQAPEHWSNEDREMFEKLDDGAQEFLLRRYKQMEGDYTRKTQENAEAIKVGRLLDEGMDPTVKADLARIGVGREEYLRQMMQWHHMSLTDPQGFAVSMMQQLRLDPAQVFKNEPGDESETPDPTTQRIAAVEQHITQEQQNRLNTAVQQTQNRVNDFANEKDEAGNLKHPHFEKVRVDMATFVRVDPNMSLEQAYEAAVFKDPELRAGLAQPAPPPPVSAETKAERTKKALRAKNANIKGNNGAGVTQPKDDKPMSLRDSMVAAADEIGL